MPVNEPCEEFERLCNTSVPSRYEQQLAMHATTTRFFSSERTSLASSSPSPSYGKQIIKQALHYGSGSFLALLASVISYPVLTRLLSRADYGYMSLVSSLVFLLVSMSKVGLQNAGVRFYAECKTTEERETLESTLIVAPSLYGVALGLVVALIACLFLRGPDAALRSVVWVSGCIVSLEVALIMLANFLRAARRSRAFAVTTTVQRYGQLAVAVAVLLLVHRRLVGFYEGWLVWDVALMAFLLVYVVPVHISKIDRELLLRALAFSFPLLFMELAGNILTYGDRYVVAKSLGIEATGMYAAAYNFTMTVQALLITPLQSILFPWASEIWTREGDAKTSGLATDILSYYICIGIPVIAGTIALSAPIMVVFASSKYLAAAPTLGPLIAAQVLYGVYQIVALGQFIRKKTKPFALQLIFAACFDVGMCLWAVPRYGLAGAAWAMLATNGILVILGAASSLRLLSMRVDGWLIARSLASAAVMLVVIRFLPNRTALVNLVLGVVVGAVTYGVLFLAGDRRLRSVLFAGGLRGVGY